MAKSSPFNGCKRAIMMAGLIIFLLIGANIPSCLGLCIESERRALLDIEKDIYDPDKWLSSWRKGGDCCSWHGVACDNTTGHVTKLDLQYPYQYNLDYGTLPPPGASKLNPSLINLEHLKYLDLSMNNFSGAPIPELIGSLVHLEYLDLSSAGFYGTIPHQLGNLSSLQVLYIYNGVLPTSFSLRVDDLHWLSRLTSLYDLELSAVDLSKAVDWIHDIGKIHNLSYLLLNYAGLSTIPTSLPPVNNFTFVATIDLFGNAFNSTIPSWLLNNISSLERLAIGNCGLYGELPLTSGHVSNLKDLVLPRNQFGGDILRHLDKFPLLETLNLAFNVIDASIQDTLCNLTRLKYLKLYANQIPGSLPKTLGNLSQLQELYLSSNRLSGEIPESIGKLRNLGNFYLSHNQISGTIPNNIGNFANLKNYDVSTNMISGEIPPSLFNNSLLQQLLLSNNNISGYIPNTIGNLYNLGFLDISNNTLSGSMFFCNLSSLTYLDLSSNNLSGRLPQFQNKSSQMVLLNLANNNLSGYIPDLFGSLPNLGSLHLEKNGLSGRIPWSLKHCQQLIILDLSENRLSGSIPTWIGESLSLLVALNLRSNRFNGRIPMQLSYLSSLRILDLSQNNLTGNLPLHFENFSAMATMHDTESEKSSRLNQMLFYLQNLRLVVKGIFVDYTSVLLFVTTIDLSSNTLSGEIPNELTRLLGLCFLNLSRNQFTGLIPQDIGAMAQLQGLDISTNKISGKIPSNMSALQFLSFLNLSDNNLSGQIPTGNQFATFTDPSIYSGNQGLCGWPLPQCQGIAQHNSPPKANDKEREEHDHEDRYEMIWIGISATLGFLISFWALIGTLIIKQSIRHAYFCSVDKLYDWIYLKFALKNGSIKSITRT